MPEAREAPRHQLDHGDLEERADGRGGALDVAGQTAVDAGAKVRSITHRLGCTTKPVSVRLMISTGRGAAAATRGPW